MFKERLTRAIEEKGISKYQIAKETKITEATLSNYCNGKGKPSPSIVMQLASFLDVDFDWLLNGAGDDDNNRLIFSDPAAKYLILGKKKFPDRSSNAVISHLEKQLNEKDKLIDRLTSIIERKMDVVIDQTKKNQL